MVLFGVATLLANWATAYLYLLGRPALGPSQRQR